MGLRSGDQSKKYAAQALKTINNNLIAIDFQQLTFTSDAVGLTVPEGATYAEIRLESTATTIAARYLLLGNNKLPISLTTGIPLSNLDLFDVSGSENLLNFRIIQEVSGTHKLNIQYYR
jgi:hypothetical protein